MWPYDKPETEERPTPCLLCGNPSTGCYKDDELVMVEYCDACRFDFNVNQTVRRLNKLQRTIDAFLTT